MRARRAEEKRTLVPKEQKTRSGTAAEQAGQGAVVPAFLAPREAG